MEWIVKIENEPKKRILVSFDPQGELIIFRGQYKVTTSDYVVGNPNNIYWVDFSTETYQMTIDLETIQELLLKVYEKMNERIVVHEDLTKSFGVIKTIEVVGRT